MHQLINKKKIYFYLISFLFLSTISNNHYFNRFKKNFLINKIDIQIDRTYLKKIISQNAKFLLNNNIFSINSEILKNKFNKLNYLENIEIKKKYPSTIIIKANKTEYLAETFIEEKKYFVGRNGKFISAEYHDHKNSLPMIFGTFKIKDFLKLQSDLNRNNINLKKIKKYYYHKNKRWDLYLDKEIILMLPSNNLSDAIKIFKKYNLNNEIKIKTTIDLRIPNRIIIRNG